MHRRLEHIAIQSDLRLVAVDNKIQKPGPVFIEIAKEAHDLGAEYIYRVNDDSEFLNPWTSKFVHALQVRQRNLKLKPPQKNARKAHQFII